MKISDMDPETAAKVKDLNTKLLEVIGGAIAKMKTDHDATCILCDPDLPDDCAVLVCGQTVGKVIIALTDEARELGSASLTAQAIVKAKAAPAS